MTFKNHLTRTAAGVGPLACAALCMTGIASYAYAADSPDKIPTREVSFAGLNLTRQAHVEVLYRRIAAAANQVCDATAGPVDLATKVRVKRCVDEATAQAIADVNAPTLTQYYAAKTHQPEARLALSKAR